MLSTKARVGKRIDKGAELFQMDKSKEASCSRRDRGRMWVLRTGARE